MNKLAKSFLYVSLLALSGTAAAQPSDLLRVTAELKGPVLSEALHLALEADVPAVPEPAAPFMEPDKLPQTEYLPLNKKAVYEYEYTSSDFPGAKKLRIEYKEYSERDNSAAVVMTILKRAAAGRSETYAVYANAAGVYASNGPLNGGRMEFPLPVAVGRNWTEGADSHKITALTAKVAVPAGTYTGCLKVLTRLGGGDAGIAERFYAPGVGLVYETVTAEDRQEAIRLVSYQLK